MEVILPKYPGLRPAQISVRHLNPRPAAALTATLLDLVAYAARVDRSAVSRDAQQVLRQALAADGEAVADTFRSVVGTFGVTGAYDVACHLAASAVGPTGRRPGWSLDFPGIDDAPYEDRWVARFLSAYANADDDTARALLHAADHDGHLHTCLRTLAGSTAATLRHRFL